MQFNISEAERNFSQLIQMTLEGKEVVITHNNQPLVRLQALTHLMSKRQLGSLQGLVKSISSDFDDSLDDFQTYIK